MLTNIFFNLHVGENHNGLLVLLATQSCPHEKDCKYWSEGRVNNPEGCDKNCPFMNPMAKYRLPSQSFLYQLHLYLNDEYDKYEENRNKTFNPLTTAIAKAIGIDMTLPNWKSEVWKLFICSELCQHFIANIETNYNDFFDRDFEALKEIIDSPEYNIKRLLILGKPSFEFISSKIEKEPGWTITQVSDDNYHHRLTIEDRVVDVIYAYHPSYSRFYETDENGNSKLLPWLRYIFSIKDKNND